MAKKVFLGSPYLSLGLGLDEVVDGLPEGGVAAFGVGEVPVASCGGAVFEEGYARQILGFYRLVVVIDEMVDGRLEPHRRLCPYPECRDDRNARVDRVH